MCFHLFMEIIILNDTHQDLPEQHREILKKVLGLTYLLNPLENSKQLSK